MPQNPRWLQWIDWYLRKKTLVFAQEVKVVGGLAGKSPTFATHVACNEVWQKVLTHFLRHPYGPYWVSRLWNA